MCSYHTACVPFSDIYNLQKFCGHLRQQIPNEVTVGSMKEADFKTLQVQFLKPWHEKDYKKLKPLRYIGDMLAIQSYLGICDYFLKDILLDYLLDHWLEH